MTFRKFKATTDVFAEPRAASVGWRTGTCICTDMTWLGMLRVAAGGAFGMKIVVIGQGLGLDWWVS